MATTSVERCRKYRAAHLELCRKRGREQAIKWKARHPQKWTENQRKYSATHRDKKNEYAKKFRLTWYLKNIAWLLSYLHVEKIACTRCGYSKCFSAIDFHHTDATAKDHSRDILARHIKSACFQKWFVNTEGVFLCANCHREEHTTAPLATNPLVGGALNVSIPKAFQ